MTVRLGIQKGTGSASSRHEVTVDLNVQAFRLVNEATTGTASTKARKAAARKGGLKGGPARANVLDSDRRREIARKANEKRWDKEPSFGS